MYKLKMSIKMNGNIIYSIVSYFLRSTLPWAVTAVAAGAVVDLACWRWAARAEDARDGGGGGPERKSGALVGA